MKLIEEHDAHIVVECEKCNRLLDIDRSKIAYSDNGYKGQVICECKHTSNISGGIDDRYKVIQKEIDAALGVNAKQSNPGCMVFVYGLLITIVMSIAVDGLFGSLIFMSSLVASLVVHFKEKKAAIKRLQDEKEKVSAEYHRIKTGIRIPDSSYAVTFIDGNINLLEGKQHIWVDKDDLVLFPYEAPPFSIPEFMAKINLIKIPLRNISYFTVEGDVFHENRVSGGGGGGSSLAGAVLGGAVAGGPGAIILSRKGSNEIKSKLIVHDKRKIKLKYTDTSGNPDFLYFTFNDYNVFEKLIPQKNFELLRSSKSVDTAVSRATSGASSASDRLRELSKLRDDGILTEEEYLKKKNELLKEL